jgi:hypothetical protein
MMNPSPESSAYIYAELLVNIRQVSVVANLPSPVDGSTKAVIDGQTIRLQHQSQSSTLVIPARVVAPPILPLPDPKERTAKLSWRLPLSAAVPKPASLSLEGQALPWASVDIQKESPIQCRGCHHEIVARGAIKEWKDLPSENWAEMMEFWHCHKPHDHEKHDDEKLTQRGYGASNAIAAQPNVGFVDLTSFMVAESDCNGLLVSTYLAQPKSRPSVLDFYDDGGEEVGQAGFRNLSMLRSAIQTPKNELNVVPYLRAAESPKNLPFVGMGFGSETEDIVPFFSTRRPELWLLRDFTGDTCNFFQHKHI